MKLAALLTAAALLLTAAPESHARTFTSKKDARTMEGTLVSVAPDTVVIMRHSDKKEITVRRDALNADDQKWIIEWQQTRGQLKFSIEAVRDRVKKENSLTPQYGGSTKATSSEWCYVIKITNKAKEPLPPLTYFYSAYVDQLDRLAGGGRAGKRQIIREVTGTLATPEIAGFGTATITTRPVLVETMDSLSATATTVTSEKWIQNLSGLNMEAWWKRRLAQVYNFGGCKEYGIRMEDEEKEKLLAAADYIPVAADGMHTPQVWRVIAKVIPPQNSDWAKIGSADDSWEQLPLPLLSPPLPGDVGAQGEDAQRLRQHAVVLARRVFTVAPGADLKNLRLRYLAGALEMAIYLDGELICTPPRHGTDRAIESVKPEIAQKLAAPGPHVLAIKAYGFSRPIEPRSFQPGRPVAPESRAAGIDAGLYIEPAGHGEPPAK